MEHDSKQLLSTRWRANARRRSRPIIELHGPIVFVGHESDIGLPEAESHAYQFVGPGFILFLLVFFYLSSGRSCVDQYEEKHIATVVLHSRAPFACMIALPMHRKEKKRSWGVQMIGTGRQGQIQSQSHVTAGFSWNSRCSTTCRQHCTGHHHWVGLAWNVCRDRVSACLPDSYRSVSSQSEYMYSSRSLCGG